MTDELSIAELKAEIKNLEVRVNIEKVKARVSIKAIKNSLAGVDAILITFFTSFIITLLLPKIGRVNYQKYLDKFHHVKTTPLYKIATSKLIRKALL